MQRDNRATWAREAENGGHRCKDTDLRGGDVGDRGVTVLKFDPYWSNNGEGDGEDADEMAGRGTHGFIDRRGESCRVLFEQQHSDFQLPLASSGQSI